MKLSLKRETLIIPNRYGGVVSVLSLIVLDIAVLYVCTGLVVAVRYMLGGEFAPELYLSLSWMVLLYVLMAILTGVYTDLQTPPEALKRITSAISFFYLVAALFFFLTHEAVTYSRSIFLVSWAISLCAVPMLRSFVGKLYPSIFLRKLPCIVIGRANYVHKIASKIDDRNSSLQIAAVCIPPWDFIDLGRPQICPEDLPEFAERNPHCYAILLADPYFPWSPFNTMEKLSLHFRNVLLHGPQIDQISPWSHGVYLGGTAALTCQFKLLDPWRMRFKRVFDIAFCLTFGVALLPLFLLLYILIRIDSPGAVFFTQERLGQNGRQFSIFKFRTMRIDAEEHLARLLEENEYLASQWIKNQKLISDPRITRVGYWLRRTSIDELPQLYNVLVGSMSLVGPRPIVTTEIAKYGNYYAMFSRVKPGITGLWQVSGRNQTNYAQRVALDVTYVRNWSIYMDLWILARTVLEVLRLTGC